MNISCLIRRYLACPFVVLLSVTLLATFSLTMAYTAQFAYDLEPCILCLYQRIPFALVIIFGILGMALKKLKPAVKIALFLSGLAMLANSALAAFHTGVENKWWVFGEEGCAVPDFTQKPETLMEYIMKAPTVACDQIAWSDPILGLSMANYNIVWCFGLALICFVSLALSNRCAAQNLNNAHNA